MSVKYQLGTSELNRAGQLFSYMQMPQARGIKSMCLRPKASTCLSA